ncbi:hypothetical protein V2A60_008591 [Cordyceps javanica]
MLINAFPKAAVLALAACASALPAPAVNAPANSTGDVPQNAWEQEMLDTHNRYRREHSAAPLQWNQNLAQNARAWVGTCKGGHQPNSPHGENIAAGPFTDKPASFWADLWGEERERHKYDQAGYSAESGHFTQMVWKATTQLGCAVKLCKDKKGMDTSHVACEYEPIGNWAGQFRQNVGPYKPDTDGNETDSSAQKPVSQKPVSQKPGTNGNVPYDSVLNAVPPYPNTDGDWQNGPDQNFGINKPSTPGSTMNGPNQNFVMNGPSNEVDVMDDSVLNTISQTPDLDNTWRDALKRLFAHFSPGSYGNAEGGSKHEFLIHTPSGKGNVKEGFEQKFTLPVYEDTKSDAMDGSEQNSVPQNSGAEGNVKDGWKQEFVLYEDAESNEINDA